MHAHRGRQLPAVGPAGWDASHGPTALLTVEVHGKPAGQGSKTKNPAGAMYESNPRTRPWRAKVTDAARQAIHARTAQFRLGQPGSIWAPIEGPIGVLATFTFARPKSHPKRRKTWPITQANPDVDKLQRAILDGLTDAGVWHDDSQVVTVIAHKAFPNDADVPHSLALPGAVIEIWQVTPCLEV